MEERDNSSFLLDIAATDAQHVSHVLTDGLAGDERKVLPMLGLLCKSRREQNFPQDLLQNCLNVNIAEAQASREEDKVRILNILALPRTKTSALDKAQHEQHPKYEEVNRALASHFALASLGQAYRNPGSWRVHDVLQFLQQDEEKPKVQLSLTECYDFQDEDFQQLINKLPSKLQNLRLDLGFTGLKRVDALQVPFENLKTLILRFTGSLQNLSALSALMCPTLRHLELWFSNLPDLEDIELGCGNEALLKLHLEEPRPIANSPQTVNPSSF